MRFDDPPISYTMIRDNLNWSAALRTRCGWIILLVIKRSSNIIMTRYVITMQLWYHEDRTATLITQALARCFRTCTAFLADNKSNSTKNPRGLCIPMNHRTDYMQMCLKIAERSMHRCRIVSIRQDSFPQPIRELARLFLYNVTPLYRCMSDIYVYHYSHRAPDSQL